MNPVIEAIKGRRSVRSFKATAIPRDMIEAVIDAGNWAPTINNMQAWRFVVAQDKEFRQKLVSAARPTFRRVLSSWIDTEDDYLREHLAESFPKCLGWLRQSYEDTMQQVIDLEDGVYWSAPVVIFVIGTAPQECAMVCENVMLAAHSLGLGSCIVAFGGAIKGDEEIVEALELKENETIYGPIVVGYPHIFPEPPKKRDPVVKWI